MIRLNAELLPRGVIAPHRRSGELPRQKFSSHMHLALRWTGVMGLNAGPEERRAVGESPLEVVLYCELYLPARIRRADESKGRANGCARRSEYRCVR